jgi:hypothetical protein
MVRERGRFDGMICRERKGGREGGREGGRNRNEEFIFRVFLFLSFFL